MDVKFTKPQEKFIEKYGRLRNWNLLTSRDVIWMGLDIRVIKSLVKKGVLKETFDGVFHTFHWKYRG